MVISVMSDSIPLIEYMYNAKYGGFEFSDDFIKEYKERYGKSFTHPAVRSDQNAIALFKERGQWDSCLSRVIDGEERLMCSIALAKIPTMYLDFVKIHEYDGIESLSIDHNAYIVDKLKRLDPNDSDTCAALIQEASNGVLHPGENMWMGKTEYWHE